MKLTKLLLAVAIVMCGFLTSCDDKSDKLTNAIPANAVYVANINAKSLVEKSDYNIFDNILVKRGVSLAQTMLSDKDALDMLDAFTKDVNSIGLNIKGDCYIYTDYNTVGFIVGVNDAEKVKQALVKFARMDDEMIKKDDSGIYSMDMGRGVVVCWDKDKLQITSPLDFYSYYRSDDNKVDYEALAKKQLTQKKEESINSVASFADFVAQRKDISYFYSLSNFDFIEKMSGMDIPEEIKKELNELKGISSMVFVSFEKGEIKANSKMYYANSDVEKKYKELTEQLTGSLNGDQLKYIQGNPLFFVSGNLKGEGIYSYLSKLGLMSKLEREFSDEDLGIDLKTLFGHFTGDMTFSLRDVTKVKKSYSWGEEVYEYDSTEPMIAFMAEVKDGSDLLKLITQKMEQFEENLDEFKIDDNTYKNESGGMTYYFGLKDNNMYVTNDETFFKNLSSSDLKNAYSGLAKNNVFVLGGSLDNVKDMIMEEVRDEKVSGLVNEGLNLLGVYSFTTSKDLVGEGKIEITDKSKNSLAVICSYLDKVLGKVNDEVRF